MLEEVEGWMDSLPIGLLELDSLSNQSMIVVICWLLVWLVSELRGCFRVCIPYTPYMRGSGLVMPSLFDMIVNCVDI